MFSLFYKAIIFNPLYNGLILLMDLFPWMDAGVAVIVFTIIVRLILFPLSKKAVLTQIRMKMIEPEINALKQKFPNDRQAQSLKMMELYKSHKISPFSSIFLLLIQLPIIYALYAIFIRSGLPMVNTDYLYSFVHIPTVNMHFLGFIDISASSVWMSILAAIAQFLQLHFSPAARAMNVPKPLKQGAEPDFASTAQSMTKNMKYFLPIMIFFISYRISAVVALYWTVTSLFTLAQEIYIRARHLT